MKLKDAIFIMNPGDRFVFNGEGESILRENNSVYILEVSGKECCVRDITINSEEEGEIILREPVVLSAEQIVDDFCNEFGIYAEGQHIISKQFLLELENRADKNGQLRQNKELMPALRKAKEVYDFYYKFKIAPGYNALQITENAKKFEQLLAEFDEEYQNIKPLDKG